MGISLIDPDLVRRCALLPRLYDHRDAADVLFSERPADERLDALYDAIAYGALPAIVEVTCLQTLQPRAVETHLLRRLLQEVRGLRRDLETLVASEGDPHGPV